MKLAELAQFINPQGLRNRYAQSSLAKTNTSHITRTLTVDSCPKPCGQADSLCGSAGKLAVGLLSPCLYNCTFHLLSQTDCAPDAARLSCCITVQNITFEMNDRECGSTSSEIALFHRSVIYHFLLVVCSDFAPYLRHYHAHSVCDYL